MKSLHLPGVASFLSIFLPLLTACLCLSPVRAQVLASAPAQVLVQGSVAERQHAARQLANIADDAAVDALIAGMHDENPLVRGVVAESLGRIGAPRAVPVLVDALKDDFALVVLQAVIALGRIPDPAAVDALLPIARDAQHPEYQKAVLALGERADPRVFDRLCALYLQQQGTTHAGDEATMYLRVLLSKYPVSTVEGSLLAALKNPEHAARALALELLQPGPLTPPLTEAVLGLCTDPQVGYLAVSSLAHSTDPHVAPALLDILHQPDARWRHAALDAFAGRHDPQALIPISELLSTEADMDVRSAAVRALAGYQDARATEALLAAVRDKEPSVVVEAIRSLQDRTDPRINDALLPFLNTSSAACEAALNVLGARAERRAAPALIARLAECLRHPEQSGPYSQDNRIFLSCCQALAHLRPAVRAAQVAMLQAGGAQAQDALAVLPYVSDQRLVDPLLRMLREPNADLRLAAARAFGAAHPVYTPVLEVPSLPHGENAYALDGTPDQLDNRINALLAQQHSSLSCKSWTADRRVVEALVALLDDPENPVRNAAACSLGLIGDPLAVPSLMQAARNTDDLTLRMTALNALGSIGDPRAKEVLLPRLTDADRDVRMNAIFGCAHLADKEALHALLPIIQQEGDKSTRRSILFAMAANPHPLALQALLANLQSEDPMWRDGSSWALSTRGDVRAVDALLAEQRNTFEWSRSAAAEALLATDDARALPAMVEGLQDGNSRYRIRCAHWLMQHDDPRGLPAYLTLLDDPDEMTQEMAQAALPDCRDPRIVPLLLATLRRLPVAPSTQQQQMAIYPISAIVMLGEFGDRRALEPLAALPAELSSLAALPLSHLHDQRAIAPLREILKGKDPSQAIPAALALARLGQAEGFDALAAMTQGTDENQREMVLLALADVLPGEPPALPAALSAALAHPDALTRVLAARALLARRDARALPVLIAAVQQDGEPIPCALARGVLCDLTDPTLRTALATAPLLTPLTAEVQDHMLSEARRGEALRLLGVMQAPHVVELAETLLHSDSLLLRDAAIVTLGKLPDSPRVLTPLLAALQDDDPYLRRDAALGLGALKNTAAIAPLRALLANEKVTIVHRAAEHALTQLTGEVVSKQ